MSIKKPLLGVHMSIAGGAQQALYRGASIGCTAIQIFTSSNRQWSSKLFTPEQIELFKTAQQETGITHVVAHASYLINLGSSSLETCQKSIHALEQELRRCEQLGIAYLVLHPGAGLKDRQACLEQVSAGLTELFKSYTGPVMILLETMAGQGSTVGATFEELAFIRSQVKHNTQLGVCLDTCHVWAAGYDFSTKDRYTQMWHHFDSTIGLAHLHAIHLNDSQKPQGSRVDRHAHIGKGTIPLEGFRLLMNDPKLEKIPKILEIPKEKENLEIDRENIQTLLDLIKK